MNIKLIATDIDGVWTDGGMYYDNAGGELKKFHVYDGGGVLLAKVMDIPVCILTGEHTTIVENRAAKLKIDYVFQAQKNKLETLTKLCNDLKIDLSNVAYIGDDFNDLKVLEKVGYSALPSSAPKYFAKFADKVLTKKGGEGVFREFVESLLEEHGLLEEALSRVMKIR
ncbi:MAG: HAD hydrolase family protein [Reichenbachiella sp.]|uniref:KdsC family phosphatase n=1 Tax=Reichenbachiella sp. TaxID=2184521 RepID=UPI003264B16F